MRVNCFVPSQKTGLRTPHEHLLLLSNAVTLRFMKKTDKLLLFRSKNSEYPGLKVSTLAEWMIKFLTKHLKN